MKSALMPRIQRFAVGKKSQSTVSAFGKRSESLLQIQQHKIVYYDLLNDYYDLQNDNYDFLNGNNDLENTNYHFPTPIYNCGNNNNRYQTASHKFTNALCVGLITSTVLKMPFYS
jgi:hypothetical protein